MSISKGRTYTPIAWRQCSRAYSFSLETTRTFSNAPATMPGMLVTRFVLAFLPTGMYRQGGMPSATWTDTLPDSLCCGRGIRQIRFVFVPRFPTVFIHPFSETNKSQHVAYLSRKIIFMIHSTCWPIGKRMELWSRNSFI